MRRAALVTLFVAACLAAWSSITSAQAIDSSAWEQSCYEQKSICVSACGTQTNAVECEAQCHDEVVDCLEERR